MELFFDLVFVFAVTGVSRLTLNHLDWVGLADSIVVFWLVWWAWTQLTWALNGANMGVAWVRGGTLAATVVALLMSVSIDAAFEGTGGLWFVVPYVLVRILGLALYLRVAIADAAWFAAVRRFATLSLLGLASALAGGFADPSDRVWWWLGTIGLDMVAALVSARRPDFNLRARHFAERHGLFVIIALGESLLAVAVPAVGVERSVGTLIVLVAAVALVCLLWWTYFGWFKDELEHELAKRLERRDAQFARDAYSLLHFPLVIGIIGIALGLEAMIAHPETVVEGRVFAAFIVGIVLFVASTVPMWVRAGRGVLRWRIAFGILVPLVLLLVRDRPPLAVLLVAAACLLALVLIESARPAGPGAQSSVGSGPSSPNARGPIE